MIEENIEITSSGLKLPIYHYLSNIATGFIFYILLLLLFFKTNFLHFIYLLNQTFQIGLIILIFILSFPIGILISSLSYFSLGKLSMFFEKKWLKEKPSIINEINVFSLIKKAFVLEENETNWICIVEITKEILQYFYPLEYSKIRYMRATALLLRNISFLSLIYAFCIFFVLHNIAFAIFLFFLSFLHQSQLIFNSTVY